MVPTVDIKVLGETSVALSDGGYRQLSGYQAGLLTVLALQPRKHFRAETLQDIVYNGQPSGGFPDVLSRVRKTLGPGILRDNGRSGISRQIWLDLEDDAVDISRLERLLHSGRRELARRRYAEALAVLTQADALAVSTEIPGLEGTAWEHEPHYSESLLWSMAEIMGMRALAAAHRHQAETAYYCLRELQTLIKDADYPDPERLIRLHVTTVARTRGREDAARDLAGWKRWVCSADISVHTRAAVDAFVPDELIARALDEVDTEALSEQEQYDWSDIERLLGAVISQIGDWHPEVVVGINRGGAIVGGLVAKRLGLPGISLIQVLYSVEDEAYTVVREPVPEPAARVLVTDDSYRRGDHARVAKAHLRRLFPDAEIRYAVFVEFPQDNPAADSMANRRVPGGPDIAGERNRSPEFKLPWDPP